MMGGVGTRRRSTLARGGIITAAVLVGLVCAWTILGMVTSETYGSTVLRAEPAMGPAGSARTSRFEEAVRITWPAPGGALEDHLLDPLAEVGEGDRLTVTRSRLTGDLLVIDTPGGRLVDTPFPLRTAVVILLTCSVIVIALVLLPLRSGERRE